VKKAELPDGVAFVHDWLNGMRGGEKCLEALGRKWPDAPVYTLLYRPECVSEDIRRHPVEASAMLARIPGFASHYRNFLPLFPRAVEAFELPEWTRLVISMSHCVAKGVRPPAGAKHLCYCFTPMRYAWGLQEEYFGRNPLKRAALAPVLAKLRSWDKASAARVDRFVAISEHVRRRIEACYGRETDVVFPPVATDFYTRDPAALREDFALVVSALVPYKRIDLAIAACRANGKRLKIAGTGSDEKKLRALAEGAPNITFEGRPGDEEIRALYRTCRYLLFPGEEDFGIVPVEAQACGAPVVAFRKGGALETIREDETGVFFGEQTPEALCEAMERADGMIFDGATIRRNAERFTEARFLAGMEEQIRRTLEG
jgi:glycosyltransferase involved in cell wall biosynthesis